MSLEAFLTPNTNTVTASSPRFVRNSSGGYSDISQQSSLQSIVAWQEDMFWFSNVLYYSHDKNVLSDSSYDEIVLFLEKHYDLCSEELKKIAKKGSLKVSAYMMTELSEDRKKRMEKWLARQDRSR